MCGICYFSLIVTMNMVARLFELLFLGLALVVNKTLAHNCHGCHGHQRPHGLPLLPPLPPPGFPGTGQAPVNVPVSVHTHPLALPRTRFVISKLWNGSDDTVSQASDKGGDQVFVTVEGW